MAFLRRSWLKVCEGVSLALQSFHRFVGGWYQILSSLVHGFTWQCRWACTHEIKMTSAFVYDGMSLNEWTWCLYRLSSACLCSLTSCPQSCKLQSWSRWKPWLAVCKFTFLQCAHMCVCPSWFHFSGFWCKHIWSRYAELIHGASLECSQEGGVWLGSLSLLCA